MSLSVVVLAAGEGKRFHSSTPKPLHEIAGRPLLWHVLAAAAGLRADTTVVVTALPALPADGDVLVLYGDAPLLTLATLEQLLATHRELDADATVLTCEMRDPAGYGRILRDADGALVGVVEHRDATVEQRAITEVNSGLYVFRRAVLAGLAKLEADNDQGECYLPDLVPLVLEIGGTVAACRGAEGEIRGVNDRVELAEAAAVLRRRMLVALM